MAIIDTSLLVPLVRSRSDDYSTKFAAAIADLDIFLTSIAEIELLQGARDEGEWRRIEVVLARQEILRPVPECWRLAARTHFELRRQGRTVRSVLDCLVAEIAINQEMTLLHLDRDFETIATVRPLKQRRLDIAEGI
ncbi:MAG: PIN domain nuclease [Hyphomicrobiaceae bacterium]|nr:PIN domain nuclease [Hyphomicrobiaceae bacterium]